MKSRREKILATLRDCVTDLLYYDRREDSALPVGAIEEAINNGEISVEDIIGCLEAELRNGLKP